MENLYDSEDRIARSNIYIIFGELLRAQINDNDDGKLVLKKAGLSTFIDEIVYKLCPYSYNGVYRNENVDYNPEAACVLICEKIENNEDVLVRFLNSILEDIHEIKQETYGKLSNFLNIIGYEILIKEEGDVYYTRYNYELIPSARGVQLRNEDMTYLNNMLKTYHGDIAHLYKEAISDFGTGQYVSCVNCCRSLFESFFRKMDPEEDYVKGILAATGEKVIENGNELKSIKKIYEHWLEYREGANRFRLFQTMYSVMSGLGPHNEEIPTKEDALLLLRYVEDCLLWCFRKV